MKYKSYIAYTDGAAVPNPGYGSWSYVVYKDGKIIDQQTGFEKQTTNNRMEMYAVLQVMKKYKDVTINSDSDLTVKAVNLWMFNWQKNKWKTASKSPVKNLDLVKDLYRFYNEDFHKLLWIRGHNGSEGNELVDKMCKNTLIENIGKDLYDKLSNKNIIIYRDF